MRNSPMLLLRFLFIKRSITAKPINGMITSDISTLNPNSEIIQAVNVVPTLAPKITAMDWANDIRPALTKLTTMTVDADEL